MMSPVATPLLVHVQEGPNPAQFFPCVVYPGRLLHFQVTNIAPTA